MRAILTTVMATAFGFAASSQAAIIVFNIDLLPGEEVPAPTLGGFTPSGTATITANTATLFVEITGTYTGMTSDVNNSHLHGLAGPGFAAGVLFGLANDGGTSGTFSGSDTLGAADFQGLLDGQTYINIHTVNNGPGEIRGQVVPTPGAAALLLTAGLASVRRRR